MKKYLLIATTILAVIIGLSACKPSPVEENCTDYSDTTDVMIYVDMYSHIFDPNKPDTTQAMYFVRKNDLNPAPPSLSINGKTIPLEDDGNSPCFFGTFNHAKEKFTSEALNDFLFGQTNNLVFNSRVNGEVIDTFRVPKLLGITPPADNIIRKSQNFVLTFTNTSDIPIKSPPGVPGYTYTDYVDVWIFYDPSFSDLVTYPGLPRQSIYFSTAFETPLTTFTIDKSDLQRFPTNGIARVLVQRNSEFRQPFKNGKRVHIISEISQAVYDNFIIKD